MKRISIFTLALTLCMSMAQADPVAKPQLNIAQFRKERQLQEDRVLNVLLDDGLWNRAAPKHVRNGGVVLDKDAQALLGANLALVRELRMKSAVPILVKYIAYNPYEFQQELRMRSLDAMCPVGAALREIGLPAVTPLYRRLKLEDEDQLASGPRWLHIGAIITCLERIYLQSTGNKITSASKYDHYDAWQMVHRRLKSELEGLQGNTPESALILEKPRNRLRKVLGYVEARLKLYSK